MKFRYAIWALGIWLVAVACSKEAGTAPVWSDDYIRFGVPRVTVETKAGTDGGCIDGYLPGGASFGVLGYCLAYNLGTTTYNSNSGTSLWGVKSNLCPPSVFYNEQVTMDATGAYATYGSPKKWYTDGNGNEGLEDINLADTDEFQYTFYAYYPYDGSLNDGSGFSITPESATVAGSPKITYTMPYSDNKGEIENFETEVPDAMMAVTYNVQRDRRMVDFNFFHITTALGFQVNNYSQVGETVEDDGDKGVDLRIYSIKLTGTFFRSVTADMSESAVNITYDADDTYQATFVLFENEDGTVIPWQQDGSAAISMEPEKYVRLLAGNSEKGVFGPSNDVSVVVDYELGENERKEKAELRPGSFVPSPGTRYTAQLNWVNDAFVLIMQPDNGDLWEDGEADDGKEDNDDIIFE